MNRNRFKYIVTALLGLLTVDLQAQSLSLNENNGTQSKFSLKNYTGTGGHLQYSSLYGNPGKHDASTTDPADYSKDATGKILNLNNSLTIDEIADLYNLPGKFEYTSDWEWGIKASGNSQFPYDPSAEIRVDYYGNIVIAGHFQKKLAFDSLSIYTEDDYYSDMFLCRINSAGQVQWLKHIDAGTSYDEDLGLTVDDDQNIYLTGCFDGKFFVSKYDSLGNLIWKQNFDNRLYGYGRTITTDQFDNVYAAGSSGWEIHIAKLDYYGNVVWEINKWVNYSAGCEITDIESDALGNLYFAGVFGIDTLILDDFKLIHDGEWGDDTFFGKLDPLGNFIWVKSSSGRSNDRPQIALTVDDNLYISGSFFNGIGFDSIYIKGICCQNPTPYLAKYNTKGDIIWAKSVYTTYERKGIPYDIRVDYDNNLYLTGGYFTCYGIHCTESDSYIERYDDEGNHQWRTEFKMGSGDYSFNIDMDNFGYCYNVGYNNSVNFIDETRYDNVRSIGVGKLNTHSTTSKRTTRPHIDRIHSICENGISDTLFAQGTNIKWYKDPGLKTFIISGNTYQPNINHTDTFYVTQTVDGIESWPREVIVYKTDFDSLVISYNKDTLAVLHDDIFSYNWKLNNAPVENSDSHFIIPLINGVYSVEITVDECLKVLDFNFVRPAPPSTDSIVFVCYDETLDSINAVGENIVWYATNTYTDTLQLGNKFYSEITSNKTLFVRQTVNGITSYPQEVKVVFSELQDTILKYGPNYLMTKYFDYFKYQWSYNENLIEDAQSNIYYPQTDGLYSVTINDGICSQTLSRYFVSQPAIESKNYYVCKNEDMPSLSAEGNNVIWLAYDQYKQTTDTLFTGNSFIPEPEVFNKVIFLVRSENGVSSYPVFVTIKGENFSGLHISGSSYSIDFIGSDRGNYSYTWYFNQDTIPSYRGSSAFMPYYGNYRINVSLNNQCDTTFYYTYSPNLDSIVYICDDSNPEFYAGNYSNNTQWFADENLSQCVSSYYYFSPILYGKDSNFYVAQFNNNKVVWQQKVQVVYPPLSNLSITSNNDTLSLNYPKPYFQYLWYKADSLICNSPNCYIPKSMGTGTYDLNVQAGSCSTQLSYLYISTEAGNVSLGDYSFELYPNPVINKFSIISKRTILENLVLNVYSSNGMLILTKHFNTKLLEVDISNLQAGLYIAEIKTLSESFRYKILKY